MRLLSPTALLTLAGNVVLAGAPVIGSAQAVHPVRKIGIEQKPGAEVPKDAKFVTEEGQPVTFGKLLRGRPVLVVPVFYRCTTACRLIEDSLLKVVTKAEIGRRFPGAKELTLGVGQDFDVVFLGLNPTETPELARNKKALMMSVVEVPRVTQNWTLLTGEMHQIREVTDALGFRFTYDAEKDILNHPTGSILLTPDGKVSAYTVGNAIPSRLLQANLEAAKQGGVAPAADQAMMFGCLTLDPETGRYRPVVHRILQVTGTLTVLILAFSILSMNRKYKRTTLLPGGPDA